MSLQRSLIIPAYNEAQRLAAGYARLAPTLDTWGFDSTEIVFVDDGSTDGTLQAIQATYGHLPHLKVVRHEQNQGKGAAVRLGWASAKASHVITVDADMAIHPACLIDIDEALASSDFAPGSRALNGPIRYGHFTRTVAGALFHRVVTHYTGATIRDTQCGCKGMSLGLARLLGLLGFIEGFAYDAELFYLADQLGITPTPVPVTWDDVTGSTVRASGTRAILRDLRSIPRSNYDIVALRASADLDMTAVRRAAVSTRQRGLVIARHAHESLVVFPRDAGINAITMAPQLEAAVTSVRIDELRGATYHAV